MLLNRMTRVAVLVVATWGLLVSLTPTSYAGSFHVEISTVDLGQSPANANSPFYLNFQFNDGGVLGNNSANITNFSFAGGSASGSPIYSGSVGDLSSNVRFNNSSPFEEFFQSFTPGATISFDVSLTQNVDGITLKNERSGALGWCDALAAGGGGSRRGIFVAAIPPNCARVGTGA